MHAEDFLKKEKVLYFERSFLPIVIHDVSQGKVCSFKGEDLVKDLT